MIELKQELESFVKIKLNELDIAWHSTFYTVGEKLKSWIDRFYHPSHKDIAKDFATLYLLANNKFLDHRNPSHLLRLLLSMHFMQRKLLHLATFSPHHRHLEIKWIPTALSFPFASKPVLGCLIGFNVMDRYELFDEENVLLALRKHLPEVRLVVDSSYCHTSQHKNLKVFYFEIEKKSGGFFSLAERNRLREELEDKVKKSIEVLSPSIYMAHNEEEIYKNILVLSQEIQALEDLPQAYITLQQQTKSEIIFRVTLVHITPAYHFSLKDQFSEGSFVSKKNMIVRHLESQPIEAHLFTLHLLREPALLRSDGSLDFYMARQRIVSLLKKAIGEFRDYNGGIIIKQQELLQKFKEHFPEMAHRDAELIESFFYALMPLEQQVLLSEHTLAQLFSCFLQNRKKKLQEGTAYLLNTYVEDHKTFVIVHGHDASLNQALIAFIQEQPCKQQEIAYSTIETAEGVFLSCVLLSENKKGNASFIEGLSDVLNGWEQKVKSRKILKIALEYSLISLDPRIGGDVASEVIKLLFEGLTRYGAAGQIENGVAESVSISPDGKIYTFKLRSSLWNDGTLVSAYDFEYAWKKILSPDFKTPFAYLFDPIKNAKEAKEGKVSSSEIGINVIDDRTLQVELVNPAPYFLELTALPLYSPVHRAVDQEQPQWPYQCEKNYPCNGPFILKINQPDQGYQLVKNPLYWDASKIALDQILLKAMTPLQATEAFQQKEVDWIGSPFGGWNEFYKGRPEDTVLLFPTKHVMSLAFNTKVFPFNHPKIRQAFAYAIDRARLVSGAFLPLEPAFSPLLSHSYSHPKHQFPDIDVEKARLLFQEGLEELGTNREELSPITLLIYEKGVREYTAVCLKEQIKESFGVEVEIKALPWGKYFCLMSGGDFQMGTISWNSQINDPIYTLSVFKSAAHGVNFTKWEDPGYTRFIELSEQENGPMQRSSYLVKAEEILTREAPIIPLCYQTSQALVSHNLSRVSGYINVARICFKKEN